MRRCGHLKFPHPWALKCLHPLREIDSAFLTPELESQAHGSAPAWRLRNVNGCAMCSGDLANQRQANAAALPLSREEGYKYSVALIRRYAGAVIGHCDDDPTIGNSTRG